MVPSERRHVGSFTATGDSGRRLTIHVFRDFLGASRIRVPGRNHLLTAEGHQAHAHGAGFHVPETGEWLTTDDPAAGPLLGQP